MVWDRKKAHYEPPPPKVEEEPEDLSSGDWSETTPDAQTLVLCVEETPDPREGAAPVDTYLPRPRREEAPPEI